jgi:flagellar biogenesis protein FliO
MGGDRLRLRVLLSGVALMAAAVLSCATPAIAEPTASTHPAVSATDKPAAPLDPAFESRPIGSSHAANGDPTTNPATATLPTTPAHSIGFDLTRMAIALAIVLAMIFGARWLFAHFFAGARAPATSKAVKVLGRTSLAPRQQVLLLQVGRRVVVVGESNGNLATLAQLDDPDEVARLVGQLQEEQIQRAASFGGLFGRAQRKMAAEDEHSAPVETGDDESSAHPPTESVEGAAVKSELSGLLEKVRTIRNQLGR